MSLRRNYFAARLGGGLFCLALCLLETGCTSTTRSRAMQEQRRRYVDACRALPDRPTRAELYAALPPAAKPVYPYRPGIYSFPSLPPSLEVYPLDQDFELLAEVQYHQPLYIDLHRTKPGLPQRLDDLFLKESLRIQPLGTEPRPPPPSGGPYKLSDRPEGLAPLLP